MRQLRVGIDGYNLALLNGTGIATYGLMLGRTLRAMGHHVDGVFGLHVGREPAGRQAEFFDRLVRPPPAKQPWRKALRTVEALSLAFGGHAVTVPKADVITAGFSDRLPEFDRLFSRRDLFEHAYRYFRLTGRIATLEVEQPPNIMHWTYPIPLRLKGARNICTVHDIVPLRLPHASLDEKQRFRAMVAACIDAADQVCTVSEASRRDIVGHFDVAPEKISNTYQVSSIDDALLAEDPEATARAIEGVFGLRRHAYFLYFGAIEPKKNLGRLIEAYLSLQSPTPLVIVGARSWQSERELLLLPPEGKADQPQHAHIGDRIIRVDYLPRRLLMQLVRGAKAVAFPSLYEGFGLPVHEAMLLGAPVLSSTEGSLPEIAGDAAMLVDPYDVCAIANGLKILDKDENLRLAMSERGQVQAQSFSADRYRERLQAMYDTVLSR